MNFYRFKYDLVEGPAEKTVRKSSEILISFVFCVMALKISLFFFYRSLNVRPPLDVVLLDINVCFV